MSTLLHELVFGSAETTPDATALRHAAQSISYARLARSIHGAAAGLLDLGLSRQGRVGVYLPKRAETVITLFGAALAGGVFVPVNPQLKAAQVAHILRDCNVEILITAEARLLSLEPILAGCPDLRAVVLIDRACNKETDARPGPRILGREALPEQEAPLAPHRVIDEDMAAILYTSGSTGRPKGVVLSHRNLVAGARSVVRYLGNRPDDRILAVLPLSFDYGLSQLTTALLRGACAVLMDYLLPRDVIATVRDEGITGLAGIPALWAQLARLPWPAEASGTLRYLTNSGGPMPRPVLAALREALPRTRVYLMYGLTEAFRSTYLPPGELDRRPDSIGRAIPNAEVQVVRPDGTPCAPGEPGELVHRGALVAKGYWNAPQATARVFRPAPGQPAGIPVTEAAVWSGDTVRMDAEGFLYFIGRRDHMIKSSGYRISPTEVEETLHASALVGEAAAIGAPHPLLGQGVVAVVTPPPGAQTVDLEALSTHCRARLPNFMLPQAYRVRDKLPLTPHGKVDRNRLIDQYADTFQERP